MDGERWLRLKRGGGGGGGGGNASEKGRESRGRGLRYKKGVEKVSN